MSDTEEKKQEEQKVEGKRGDVSYPQKVGTGMIVEGWIFAVLGGLIGIAIGASIAIGKMKTDSGEKICRYDEESRKKGTQIMIVAIIMFILWDVLFLIAGN